jgi:hypothetical protein
MNVKKAVKGVDVTEKENFTESEHTPQHGRKRGQPAGRASGRRRSRQFSPAPTV